MTLLQAGSMALFTAPGGDFAYLAIVFFVLAIVAFLVGFQGVAGISMDVAKILIFVFIVLAIVSLLLGGGTGDDQGATATCVGDCEAVESVSVEPSAKGVRGGTDITVVFDEPVRGSVVLHADGDPLSEETLNGERLLETNVDGDHYDVTVDVHREGGGSADE